MCTLKIFNFKMSAPCMRWLLQILHINLIPGENNKCNGISDHTLCTYNMYNTTVYSDEKIYMYNINERVTAPPQQKE